MVTEKQRSRFEELYDKEIDNDLSAAERRELDFLTKALVLAEEEALRSSTERLQAENEAAAERNRALSEVLEDKRQLAERYAAVIKDLQAERRMIDRKLKRILAEPRTTTASR
jgi:hypothetical protein